VSEPVRTPVGIDTRRRGGRSVDERFFVRWPAVWRAVARLVQRLPQRARLRRVLLRRAVLTGMAAFARWDLELMLVLYAPECQLEMPPEFVNTGMRSVYEGHRGLRDLSADLREAFDEMAREPREIVDAGDRAVVLGRIHTRARQSGVELDSPVGDVGWVEHGLIVRQCVFLDWNAALRSAGIPQ
jgi:ketosteroid isomerase-like protein